MHIRDAAIPIKSYSPEVIVYPYLSDNINGVSKTCDAMSRMDAVVIGPGLGRADSAIENVEQIIGCIKKLNKLMVIDADGLWMVARKPSLVTSYSNVVLTPNLIEFQSWLQVMSTSR